MSMEEELNLWLRRAEKPFSENLSFALKAWQSAELTLITKYEVILNWLIEVAPKFQEFEELPLDELEKLFNLRAQPGCVAHQIKIDFIEALLQLINKYALCDEHLTQQLRTRRLPELVQKLLNFVLLQDVFRSEFELQARTYALLFNLYERYLRLQLKILPAHESAFFGSIMSTLKDNIKRASNVVAYKDSYTTHMLAPLTQTLLVLQSQSLDYSSDFNQLEQQLCEAMSEDELLERIWKSELHVRLRTLDSAIYNRHMEENFLSALLLKAFPSNCSLLHNKSESEQVLSCAAYTLELLRRNEAKLNFKLQHAGGDENLVEQSAIQFLGERILNYVTTCKDKNLSAILQLSCAALRLNPLILENCVFRLTVWFMLLEKPPGSVAESLYAEFLALLLDMYRRLSRTEKFVTNLLKTVKEECLNNNYDDDDDEMEKNRKKKGKQKEEKQNFYMQLLFNKNNNQEQQQQQVKNNNNINKLYDFPQLQNKWPYASAGKAFSALVAGLVTKASLVVWKSLLYALKDLLESLKSTESATLSKTVLFQLDLHAALLCQYYDGSRLTEHWQQYYDEINNLRDFSNTILSNFGNLLLQREHEAPATSAFLECCYHAINSELILIYYRPDSIKATNLEVEACAKLFALLSEQQWILLQQRIVNFGQERCKLLLTRVQLQRNLCNMLFVRDSNSSCGPLFNDLEQQTLVLTLKDANASWLVPHLCRAEKIQIICQLWQQKCFDLLQVFSDDLEALNFISLTAFEKLHETFKQKSEDSLYASVACNFNNLRKHITAEDMEHQTADKAMKQIVSAFKAHTAHSEVFALQRIPNTAVKCLLSVMQELRFKYLRHNLKTVLFGWLMMLYADLRAAQAHDLAAEVCQELADFLKFDQHMALFKHFPLHMFLRLLPALECWTVYELLFANIRTEDESTLEFLRTFTEDLKESQSNGKLNKTQQRLMVLAIERMSTVRGLGAKKLRKHFDGILETFGAYVLAYFERSGEVLEDENSKKTKKFVEKTLAGFAPYAQALLLRQQDVKPVDNKKDEKENEENKKEKKKSRKRKLDEDIATTTTTKTHVMDNKFQRICRIYIGHSLSYRNPHAIRLMELAVSSQKQLQLGKDEIEFVLSSYWRQLNEDLKAKPTDVASTLEAVVKLIIGNMINEDLLITLRYMHDFVTEPDKYCLVVMQLLNLIAKCHFSKIKGAIFNEQFKQITCRLILHLSKDEQQHFMNFEHVRHILKAQCTLAENKTIPITPDSLDNMLTLMLDVDIKSFQLSDINSASFFALHSDMVELCKALIMQRHVLLLTRVPQLMHLFKDLIESLIGFKSDREKDAALTATDLESLIESTHKLEVLMNLISQHGVEVKRIVPFVLTFIMNLMVTTTRPTTLYPQIKAHVDNICLSLIGICDHKAGPFILRMSNEASRQVYESLLKEHSKYHAFKGKV